MHLDRGDLHGLEGIEQCDRRMRVGSGVDVSAGFSVSSGFFVSSGCSVSPEVSSVSFGSSVASGETIISVMSVSSGFSVSGAVVGSSVSLDSVGVTISTTSSGFGFIPGMKDALPLRISKRNPKTIRRHNIITSISFQVNPFSVFVSIYPLLYFEKRKKRKSDVRLP